MIIELKGKEMELNFGVGFIRSIDKKTEQTITSNGYNQKFSEGIAAYIPQLILENPVFLADLIDSALWKYKGAFKETDIDEYIDGLDSEAYSKLFEDILAELEEANATRKVVKKMKEELAKNQ